MDAPILRTKLNLPVLRPQRVVRRKLIDWINAGLWDSAGFSRALTFVSAPAGYGKTTLVVDWLRELNHADPETRIAWLSLDTGDNDPTLFLTYLVATLQSAHPDFGQESLAILQSPQPPPPNIILATLLNEINGLPVPTLLVMDDYHELQSAAIHRQIGFLLEHLPPHFHLVLTTREDPLLPLARMRAQGQMLEVRSDQLRFSSQECVQFLNEVMGIQLSSEHIAALERRTEGWIAGLQLAALSLRTHPDPASFVAAFTGSSRFILDYLVEEVIQHQPAAVQEFLVQTAILERLCGPLCDAVTGGEDGQHILETLEQANLFIIPLDQSRQWYRYHRLFSELLRHRLRGTPAYQPAELHQRAGEWYASQGLMPEAIQHALSAGNWTLAGEWILQVDTAMLKRGETVTLLRWFSAFPPETWHANPRLCFEYCWPLLLNGQFETVAPFLDRLEQVAADIPEFLGEVLAAQAYLARAVGDETRLVERSQRALTLLPKTSLNSRGIVTLNLGLAYWHTGQMAAAETALAEALEASQATGNHYATLTALIFQGRILAVRGQLHPAAALARRAIEQGEDIPINALAHLDLAALHYEWDQLAKCQTHLERGLLLSQRGQNDEFTVGCKLMQARLQLALGDLDGTRQTLASIQAYLEQGGISEGMARRVAAMQSEFALQNKDLETALDWAKQAGESSDSHNFMRFLGLVTVRVNLAINEHQHARGSLERLYKQAAEAGWGYGRLLVRIWQALSAESPGQALAYLAEALHLGQPEGYIRSFVEAGPKLVPVLRAAAQKGVEASYVGTILAAMPTGGESAATPDQAGLVEPLSERELEVLHLVAAGLSNRQIADQLIISPGTAKTHVHNICGKLGARNRTEAATRAKEIGLV